MNPPNYLTVIFNLFLPSLVATALPTRTAGKVNPQEQLMTCGLSFVHGLLRPSSPTQVGRIKKPDTLVGSI